MITELQNVLYSEIPITKALGITVKEFSNTSLTLSAPLENNLNHKSTAFGGSLYSVAVLSGWGLIYWLIKSRGLKGHIVIQQSSTNFNKPVVSDITARCSFESEQQIEKFIRMYKSKGKARIKLQSVVMSDSEIGVLFNGSYVIHQ